MPSRRMGPLVAATAVSVVLASAATLAAPPAATSAPRTAVGVHLAARTSLAQIVRPTVLVDRGTISGSPVGSGRITLVYRLRPATGIATVAFSITSARGTIRGLARTDYAASRARIVFTGTASFTRGTRAYAGIRGRPLAFSAVHSIIGLRAAVALRGRATLP